MTEKKYYKRDFEELYYIIDSEKVSEKEFDEKVMYDGYSAFEDSLTGEEIVDLLNENDQLKKELEDCQIKKQNIKDLLMNAEPIVEQKKLQKIIYGMIISKIDDKIKENQPTMLSVKIPMDCADKKACLHNHEVNVASMAKYNILNELKKELEDVVNDG